jgi:tetratricopeptide (TPR) repeat protein
LRAIGLAAAGAGVAAFLLICWLVWDNRRAPEDAERSGAFGPASNDLYEAALGHLDIGIALLSDGSREPAVRLAGYRAELERAEALLRRSLEQSPVHARALATLAAVRFELSPPGTDEEVADLLELIARASRMAPRVPFVQQRLGELLLRMGLADQGFDYLGRTLDLSPERAAEVLELLERLGFAAVEALDRLPPTPELLAALAGPIVEQGEASRFFEVVENRGDAWTPPLLQAYGGACVRAGQAERLLRAVDALPPFDDPELDGERLLQRGLAKLALGRPVEALADARAARALRPVDNRFSHELGRLAFEAGDLDEAERAFRASLGELVAQESDPAKRATVYRWLGWIEERRGRADRAYDEYRRALELDPHEPVARRRLAEMQDSAGTAAEP